ncbi:MAG TPA: hypothetical protein VNZ67_11545, partial [bacterium]|nr:hypothetical protein [bacterium]
MLWAQPCRLGAALWSLVASPSGADLYHLSMANAVSGQAVGAGGTLLSYAGGPWTTASGSGALTAQNLMGSQATAPGQGWAVGNDGVVLQQTGGAWSVQSSAGPPGTLALNAVSQLSPLDVWAVG